MTLLTHLQNIFSQHANELRGQQQQAYMKSTMPYWGIAKPLLTQLALPIIKQYPPASAGEYQTTLTNLFAHATRREEWYAALLYARHWKSYIHEENLEAYLAVIRYGQWWDIVDEVAVHLVGKTLHTSPNTPHYLCTWIHDENIWVQRTALITQLKYKKDTNFPLLCTLILKVAHEKDFFIRKAIGWSLREYSKTDPAAVAHFINSHTTMLSTLSIREGLRLIRE
jgi:3-methyladenine DNA glycosylase AlkD